MPLSYNIPLTNIGTWSKGLRETGDLRHRTAMTVVSESRPRNSSSLLFCNCSPHFPCKIAMRNSNMDMLSRVLLHIVVYFLHFETVARNIAS